MAARRKSDRKPARPAPVAAPDPKPNSIVIAIDATSIGAFAGAVHRIWLLLARMEGQNEPPPEMEDAASELRTILESMLTGGPDEPGTPRAGD